MAVQLHTIVDETGPPQPTWAERHHRPLETDVSVANQRRYHRAMRNGGNFMVISKRLAGPRWAEYKARTARSTQ